MRSNKQEIARELSRMWPEDRALAKAIHQGEFTGVRSLSDIVSRGLINAEMARKKKEESRAAAEIRRATGSLLDIAWEYGVSTTCVSRIKQNKTWKEA